jgi:hypothetical protein
MTVAPAVVVDEARLAALATAHRARFATATPFPHVVIDDFMPPAVLDGVLAEFPQAVAAGWTRYDNDHERKLECHEDARMGPATRHLLWQLNSSVFLAFLEALTGIDGLIPDPHFHGGGLHQIEPGGHLGIHADFGWYGRLRLDRRLNLLLYLNRDWDEAWGGHLELWSPDLARCEKRIAPLFNRCVVFRTTATSYHGHPHPLACPPDRARRSLALYYYSNGRPPEEGESQTWTQFARPERRRRRAATDLLRRLAPPIVLDAARAARRIARSRR